MKNRGTLLLRVVVVVLAAFFLGRRGSGARHADEVASSLSSWLKVKAASELAAVDDRAANFQNTCCNKPWQDWTPYIDDVRKVALESHRIDSLLLRCSDELQKYVGRTPGSNLLGYDDKRSDVAGYMIAAGNRKKIRSMLDSLVIFTASCHIYPGQAEWTKTATAALFTTDAGLPASWEEQFFGSNTSLATALMRIDQLRYAQALLASMTIEAVVGEADHSIQCEFDNNIPFAHCDQFAVVGDKMHVSAGLLARNMNRVVSAELNGVPIKTINGWGSYDVPVTREGLITVKGSISYATPCADTQTRELRAEFLALRAAGSIHAAGAMLYSNVDNHITVSGFGYAPRDLQLTASRGKVSGAGNNYILRVAEPGEVVLKLRALTSHHQWLLLDNIVCNIITPGP